MGLQFGGFATRPAFNVWLSCLEVTQEVDGPGPGPEGELLLLYGELLGA